MKTPSTDAMTGRPRAEHTPEGARTASYVGPAARGPVPGQTAAEPTNGR